MRTPLITRRLRTTVVTATALCGLFIWAAPVQASPHPGAARGGCGEVRNPSISGARAHWELSCRNGEITVSGWVEDTSSNGRCAKVKAKFASGNTEYSNAACPKNDRENFRWSHPGSIADVYLYEYDV